MKDYTNNTPIFSEALKITETSDPAHADIVNTAPIQVFQNTLCNRQSIEQLKQSAVSTEDYNPEVSYQVGDNCLYQNTLYKCVQETTGEWNPDCWKKTNILEEMKNLEKGVLYPEFDDSGEVEGITSFTDFLDSVVSKIPLVKFLRNFKAGMKFVLHAGQLVTDCVTDRDDLPVAACTVKNLMDLYTQLNSDVVLWSGELTFEENKVITLNDNISKYKYINIYVNYGGDCPIFAFPSTNRYFEMKIYNMGNNLTSISLWVEEIKLYKESDTTLKIDNDSWINWFWSGHSTDSATKSRTFASIYKIVGRMV